MCDIVSARLFTSFHSGVMHCQLLQSRHTVHACRIKTSCGRLVSGKKPSPAKRCMLLLHEQLSSSSQRLELQAAMYNVPAYDSRIPSAHAVPELLSIDFCFAVQSMISILQSASLALLADSAGKDCADQLLLHRCGGGCRTMALTCKCTITGRGSTIQSGLPGGKAISSSNKQLMLQVPCLSVLQQSLYTRCGRGTSCKSAELPWLSEGVLVCSRHVNSPWLRCCLCIVSFLVKDAASMQFALQGKSSRAARLLSWQPTLRS